MRRIKLIFHGAAWEVGRSCIELITKNYTRVLLDAGLKIGPEGTTYPEKVSCISELDAIFLSHAHLDHTGALPLFEHEGLECPVYATKTTYDFTKLLLEDAFEIGKIKSEELGYFEEDIYRALKCIELIKKKEQGNVNDIKFKFYDAGHIPGSVSIMLSTEGKNILYTGDFRNTETRLLEAANTDYEEKIDVMISEATYGDRPHPDREKTENKFLKSVKEAVEDKGSVLVPVFAVGRAQEILLVLAKERFSVPIYLDGMAVEATQITMKNPQSIRQPDRLRAALSRANIIKNQRQRENALQKRGIFITTSGMLTGGPVMDYLKNLGKNEKNSILLTGYQGEYTNGRSLLESRFVFLDGYKTKISCSVEQFDFSAHAGQDDIKRLVRSINPEVLVLNHGDPNGIESLYEWAHSLGYKVHAPKMCDEITI